MTDLSDIELLDALGVDIEPTKQVVRSPRDERIIAGFEDIQNFVNKHGRAPSHGETSEIFERIYATRLDQIKRQPECYDLVRALDHQGLLSSARSVSESTSEYGTDAELLAELGVEAPIDGDVTYLTHVKPRAEVRAADEVASRKPCNDFDEFKPIFDTTKQALSSGLKEAKLLTRDAIINQGDFFILHGQIAYVADSSDQFVNKYGRKDNRLRVIFDNRTESDLLLRSLQRALNKDETGRRIMEIEAGPLFADTLSEDDLASGTIYVLESESDHPTITYNRNIVHKIGVTGGSVTKRIARAKFDPTFLMADVKVVATYELFNINRIKLESILHKFFENAKLDIEIKDRFGQPITPREWFLVPLHVIDEVVKKIKDETISKYYYDINSASLILVSSD